MKLTVVNFHIPKTAGSTFLFRLFRSLGLRRQQDAIHNITERAAKMEGRYFPKIRKAFEIEQQDSAEQALKVFTGHYRYRDVADLIERWRDEPVLVTYLRDPVARVLSQYFYSISNAHDEMEKFVEKYPTLEHFLENPGGLNQQTAFLAPNADATVDETIEHVREKFHFVGCTERFDEDFDNLMSMLKFPPSDPVRRNESPYPDLKRDAYTKYKDVIYDRTAKDRKLYNAFCAPEKSSQILLPLKHLKQREDKNVKAENNLLNEIEDLAPWHHKIHLSGDIWTGAGNIADQTGSKVTYYDPLVAMKNLTRQVLPNGFEGRSFLDCACNGGGYSFAAKDLGASNVFGFDVREHWIKQCEFVMQNREAPTDNMKFRQADLLDLSNLNEDFDVTWFSGLFYHLPDPVTGLKNAADRTKELIFVNTAAIPVEPDVDEVPALHMKFEGTDELMSGIYRLSWSPSGPKVIEGILNWMGFVETRLIFWHKTVQLGDRRASGRLCIVGAREKGRLDGIRNAVPVDSHSGPIRGK
ncbi:bifunctional 2-polyprenyl-6-hydroxyphenol methylase/3-demethylubiquinol 3-O-methyltransferase UbiG [uncultured Litoreibacter sp.]|uniref:class I SAM-dependent methyltransferase n=1 Tax=uncultured Litoreibacter sp. TaxID=1392394 RepID=UPI0026252CAE|nr:class I SAM-dependent methyltransferase [uncultured Litoreibacter sp.]